jgi:hypothetical protein
MVPLCKVCHGKVHDVRMLKTSTLTSKAMNDEFRTTVFAQFMCAVFSHCAQKHYETINCDTIAEECRRQAESMVAALDRQIKKLDKDRHAKVKALVSKKPTDNRSPYRNPTQPAPKQQPAPQPTAPQMDPPILGRGELITMEDFIKCCKSGSFIDFDGFGNYSDGKIVSDTIVYPSDVVNGRIEKRWTHVVWFNR